jgi:hypothetical protein
MRFLVREKRKEAMVWLAGGGKNTGGGRRREASDIYTGSGSHARAFAFDSFSVSVKRVKSILNLELMEES